MRQFVVLFVALSFVAASSSRADDEKGTKSVPGVLNFKMKSLEGKEVNLTRYKGKVVLIVNVASRCGYTPQYKGLQSLYERFHKHGLVVLGVPADNFGHQEPGSNQEIKEFCTTTYHVTFPMLAKVSVKGEDQTPLYKYLTSKQTDPKFGGPIKWNFTKFLIGRDGEIVSRFDSAVKPESAKLVKAVQVELEKE
jgi:glutathione peroxidase